jgi:hypothetical protein
VIPRVSAGVRLNVVPVELPDIVADQIPGQGGSFTERYGAVVPAFAADFSLGLTGGHDITPGIGGIGGLTLIGSASYLPFEMFTDDFDEADLAYGIGGRLQLLRESFVAPALAMSVMRRHLGTVTFGDICPAGLTSTSAASPENTEVGGCPSSGDPGEIGFDLTSWSGRATVSKHLLGIGGLLGVGFDSYDSDLDFGFRGESIGGTGVAPGFRVHDEKLESTRWTFFGNLSYTLLVASLTLEGGWQQGDAPIDGFDDLDSNFDPEDGVLFGSIGFRIAL